MNDLGLDVSQLVSWFAHEHKSPYVLIRVSEECAATWAAVLGVPIRRCYITDAAMKASTQRTGHPKGMILAAKLPDLGSTMAGDIGEIIAFFYHAAQNHPSAIISPKKWRLKQDRTKPAPYSDVVHFVLPTWPDTSEQDSVVCSEVKTKSTPGATSPITNAIADCEKDRTSRLAKTLVWLKERALTEDLGTITIKHLDRFIQATDHPQAQRRFYAVAVVCASLVDQELVNAPSKQPTDYTIVVIAVPDLKQCYEAIFTAVHATMTDSGGSE